MTEVSFIICTRDRADALPRALNSIAVASQAVPSTKVDIVIVDESSTDATAAAVQLWMNSSIVPARLIDEPRLGLAVARNTGIRHAEGTILAFTDDDCEISPTYIQELLSYFANDTEITIRGGRVELGDPQDLDFTTKRSLERSRMEDSASVAGFIVGCNMTMHRSVVDRIGYFDERFGAGAQFPGADETDYVLRAYLAGMAVEYVPDMVVFHYHGRTSISDIQRLHHYYSVGTGALYAKHWRHAVRLRRHLYWDIRNAVLERFGGSTINPALGITHSMALHGKLKGMMLYGIHYVRCRWSK
jgi:GT2 family glycosyltransferase